MTTNKSIDGLSPRRSKRTASTISADGFTPLMQPRKTTKKSRPVSAPAGIIHPEDFIAPRPTKRRTPTKPVTTSKSLKKPAPTVPDIHEDFLEPTKIFDFDEETGELVSAKPSQKTSQDDLDLDTKKSSRKPRRKKWSKKRKFWTWFGIIILLLLISGGIFFVVWGNDLLSRLTGGRGNIFDLFESYEPLQQDAYGRTNILAFGTSGFDMSGTDYGGDTHDGADLTDSIMIISFDQNKGTADLISLPRDLKVDADCNYTGKVNEIYYCNNIDGTDEEGGAKALATAVSSVLGIDLPYFVHVNWGALQEIVDDLGGITVTLDEPIADYYYTGAVYDAGVPYTLSGQDAVALSRARHGTASGDFSRGASQQKILIGIKDKILADSLSVTDMIKLANTLGDNLRTNFTVGEMKSLAHLANTTDWSSITEVSFLEPEPLLTDGMIGGISYVYPTAGDGNFSEIKAYIKSLLSGDTSTGDIAKENASILVLNSTSQDGLASAEATTLEDAGFKNVYTDNYSPTLSTAYTLYSFTTDAPTTKSKLEEKYHITASTTPPSDLPTGYDFVLILGN